MIAAICDLTRVLHVVLGYTSDLRQREWTYYVSGRKSDLASALQAVVAYFGWKKVNVATSATSQLSGVAALLEQQTNCTYKVYDFTLDSPTSIENTVGKGLRLSGNRVSVLLTDPETTQVIINAQYRKSIGDVGFGNVLSLFSSLFPLSPQVPTAFTGSVVLAESGLETVETVGELYTQWLAQAARLLTTSAGINRKAHSQTNYTLVNIQAGLRIPVGFVNFTIVSLTQPVLFLGNTTAVPNNADLALQVSGNFGVDNVVAQLLNARFYYYGALLAVEQINATPGLLENFRLELFNFTAGVNIWNYTFVYRHLYPVRTQLGLAVLGGNGSGVTLGLQALLTSIGYKGPVIGSVNTADVLSDRQEFPSFVRVCGPDKRMTVVYLEMFKRFGWKHCGLFVTNETWGLGFRSVFAALAAQHNITIVNTMQVLPSPILTLDSLREHSANFLDFIASKARVLVVVVNTNAIFLIDYLYELGLRAGDLQVVANEWLLLNYFTTNDTQVNRRRSELLRGAIQITPVSFVGELGAHVRATYHEKYQVQAPVYACLYYDSVLAVALALDQVIRTGKDYVDPTVLMKSLRGSRFVGCTGTVTFDRETNDRSLMAYNILNAQFAGNHSYVTNITTVAVYDPTSTILFRTYTDLIWCDGTTKVPLALRVSTIGCPHEDRFDQDFAKGRYLLWSMCVTVGLLTALCTAVAWRVIWNHPLAQLHEQRELALNDVVVMLGICLELLQYLSLGPALPLPADFRKWVLLTTLDWEQRHTGLYVRVWLAVTSAVGVSVLASLVVLFNVDFLLERVPGARCIGEVCETAFYFCCNWLFLPIVSIYLEVFTCVRAVGPDFSDSYLQADCYERCWQDGHIVYVSISSVILLLYLPAAVVLKPLWQEIQPTLNIKAGPVFLMLQSMHQVCVLLLSKAVRRTSALVHCCLFLGLTAALLAFSLLTQSYNYRRTLFWYVLGLIALEWSSLLSLVSTLSNAAPNGLLIGLLAGGWGAIVLFGSIYQRLRIPSLLYRKKGVDTRYLFRFAFKPTTPSILAALYQSFQAVNHPCQLTSTGNKYFIGPETLYDGPSGLRRQPGVISTTVD